MPPSILAIAPIIAIFILLLVLGKTAAFTGFSVWLLTVAIAFFAPPFSLAASDIPTALIKGALICLTAGYVVFFGMVLFRLMEAGKAVQTVGSAILAIAKRPVHQAMLIVVAFSPLIESSAGFATAVIVVFPILKAVGFDDFRASLLSLVSLIAVPWGAMATGTVIGADLAQVPLRELGAVSALFSLPVFIYFTIIAAAIAGGWRETRRYLPQVVLVAITLGGGILLFSALGAVEMAGIFASLGALFLTVPMILLNEREFRNAGELQCLYTQERIIPLLKAVSPYLFLAGTLFLSRFIPGVQTALTSHFAISLRQYEYNLYPLYSPGFFLCITCVYVVLVFRIPFSEIKSAVRMSMKQTWKFALATVPFIGMSETMLYSGMTASLVQSAAMLGGGVLYTFTSAFMGGAGGFFTGSNTGSNAMFMKIQTSLAQQVGTPPYLAGAVQNATASHMTMASPSRIVLLEQPGNSGMQRNRLFRCIFAIACGVELLIALTYFSYLRVVVGS